MREQGKAGKVIKPVLGVHAGRKHQVGLVMDSRRKTGEVIGDSAVIHQHIADVFCEHYAMPLDFNNKLDDTPDWEPYADDRILLKHAYWDSNI